MSTAHSLLPPLHHGDSLTREEFLRRWEAMPGVRHAELIDGIVAMPSPVSLAHGDYCMPLITWVGLYVAATPGCWAGTETTWLMSTSDVSQPDIALRILPEFGGQSRVEGVYATGAPELVIEISQSSAARDLGPKLRLYQRSGVREYLTVLLQDEQVIWRELAGGAYQEIPYDVDRVLRSRQFPGLWLAPDALWRQDLPQLLAVVQQGTQSPEHAAFVQRLATHLS